MLIYIREMGYFIMMFFYDMDMDGCAPHSQSGRCVGHTFTEIGGALTKNLSADIF